VDINVRISIWFVADKVFGPHTNSDEVYEIAAKPVVKAAMEGVNGWTFYNMDSKLCRNENVVFLAVPNFVVWSTDLIPVEIWKKWINWT